MVHESLKTGICDFARKKPINLNIKENLTDFLIRMEAAKPLLFLVIFIAALHP